MLYELVNPSDPYVFQADSFPVAVTTAWLISSMYEANPEDGDDYFGIPSFMEDPAKEYKEQFGDSIEDFINKHNAEIVDALQSLVLGGFKDYRQYLLAVEMIDDPEKLMAFREKWNDRRSSMNNICKHAKELAHGLETLRLRQ